MSGRIRLVKGDDDTIRGDAVRDLTNELLGDLDASLALDRVEGEDYELAVAVDAAQTSPFLTDRRVVVVRNLARFSADELAPLVSYLGDPLPTTDLILVWEKAAGSTARLNPVPKKLSEALAGAGGEVVDTSVGRNAKDWVNDQLAASTVNLDKGARDLVASHLAGDLGRLAAVITTIEAAYGPGAKLDSDAVAPFLGEAGGIPPWDLTDAIDSGDIGLAIERVHRMLGAGTMHSLQVLAILTTHFRRILALEGAADVRNEADAAARLGLKGKSTFPAKKALGRANRLGYDGSAQAVGLLAQADVDLRGKTAWPEELVLEVLVARLARLSR